MLTVLSFKSELLLIKDRQFLELFAGQGEVTKALRNVSWFCLFVSLHSSSQLGHLSWKQQYTAQVNLRGVAMDLTTDPRCFDLASASGFVFLGKRHNGRVVVHI